MRRTREGERKHKARERPSEGRGERGEEDRKYSAMRRRRRQSEGRMRKGEELG